ncbi:MAG: thioredoxin domain-containing protein [Kofleriaceae bacterium]|nr:thioredoxin domain-containing protein [Kofleriaceae bacterium]
MNALGCPSASAAMTTEHLEAFTDANFAAEVLGSRLPVLVDFSADWCPPCHVLRPVIGKLADDYVGRLRVGVSDVDQNGEIATRYRIHSLPTLLVFRGGNVVARVEGGLPRPRLDTLLARLL